MAKLPETYILRGKFQDAARVCDVEIRGGIVSRVSPAGKTAPDYGSAEAILGPPLFDAQVNGICGIGLQGGNVRVEDVRAVSDHLARRGVAYWIPTLVTGALDAMEQDCRTLCQALRDPVVARAVPGIHLEGPWISAEDGPRGAHPKEHVRLPRLPEFDRLHKAAGGRILYVTLAPELPGALSFIRGLRQRGVIPSLGHHAASAAQIHEAVNAGALLCTHLGNGAASQMHRHLNPLWPQMAEDRLNAGIIADLHHLPPPVLKTMVRVKGPDRVMLVSDCTRITGLRPGIYEEFGARVELKPNGRLCLSGTDLLAGSALILLDGVLNAWRHTDMTLAQAFASASAVPARFFGVKIPSPELRPGRKAHVLLVDAEMRGRNITPVLKTVFIGGKKVL